MLDVGAATPVDVNSLACRNKPSVDQFQRNGKVFFHIRSGDTYSPDDQGVDFPTIEAAKMEAITAAREMIADMVIEGDPLDEVSDESGNIVLILPFRFVLD
jgi:hypothetical protein